MSTKYHQISLSDIFSDFQNSFIDNPPSFFSLLSEHFDLNEFIPPKFFTAFYLSIERKRLYPLQGFLISFVLQKIFSIPTDSLLLLFLHLNKELRDFCGFSKIPDTFLGDSAELYGKLFHDFHFSRALIPYNPRNESPLKKLGTMLTVIHLAPMILLFP